MKPVLYRYDDGSGMALFKCPGCGSPHVIYVDGAVNPFNNARWNWNGDLVRPTITPSIHLPNRPRCHSFITDGEIQFLSDCDHALAGKTVPLEPVRDSEP